MKKIAVIGSINMDMTAVTDRIPRPGETLHGKSLSYRPGGKGANQAVAAARLGGDVTMFGCVGSDAFGDRLLENLARNGVKTGCVARIDGESSGLAMITVGGSDNVIVVIPGANHRVTPDYLESCREQILEADLVVLQNEIPLETVAHAVRMCRKAGKFVLYDPAPAAELPADVLDMVDCLKPNEHEAALLFPGREDLDALLREHPQKLVITLGSKGVKTVLKNGELIHIPAAKAKVVDTTGAGDTFTGALAFALSEGQEFSRALEFANAAAGLSVAVPGAQDGMPAREQVCAALEM